MNSLPFHNAPGRAYESDHCYGHCRRCGDALHLEDVEGPFNDICLLCVEADYAQCPICEEYILDGEMDQHCMEAHEEFARVRCPVCKDEPTVCDRALLQPAPGRSEIKCGKCQSALIEIRWEEGP